MPQDQKPQASKPAPAQVVKKLAPADAFKHEVALMEPQFKVVLPAHVTPAKFIRVLQTAAMLEPKIITCDRRLLWGEVMKCATDGLVPDGREAVIQVFGTEPKYNPMVAGICKKARNSGEIASIDAVVVYEKDSYNAWTDEKGPHFKHVKAMSDRGIPILTYAYATTKDGGFYFEEIDEVQMAAIEKVSKANKGPWKGDFKDEMRRKSALRRLCKYRLPSSADLDTVIRRDDDPEAFVEPPPAGPAKEPPKTSSRLKAAMEVPAKPAEEPPPPTQPPAEAAAAEGVPI